MKQIIYTLSNIFNKIQYAVCLKFVFVGNELTTEEGST